MVLGIGMDIVEIDRIKKAVAKEAFLTRVYSADEIAYCKSRGKGSDESFAGRFAAKEAVLKAFGTGLRNGSLQDIEILNDSLGCPMVKLSGWYEEFAVQKGVKSVWISISHSRHNAVAQCVLEG
ncbi:MAG: holo-ACP synthase [Anaerovibrio sp.]|uniref:holo-ACP synthase n=1 Tax=Anaerovibrio sp. TaxID=1872532 RepID=UPI0025E99F7B|nr:holo-ACP synthase [Anaerovibrio sp.]MCR5177272.1 holo-ACP synthase [Anaerovibrio sp.]